MSKKLHTLLNEKWRPETLEGYICKDEYKAKFQEFINQQDIPHLLFAGKPGAGKTTIAKILVKNIDCDYLYINATDERSIDVMRDKVGAFAAAGSFKPLKIVILDEATHILQASQVILLNMMETYSLTTRFILTGNYPERLIEPLRSRCQEFDLSPPTKKVVAQHISTILDKEEIEYEIEDLVLYRGDPTKSWWKVIDKTSNFATIQKAIVDDRVLPPVVMGGAPDGAIEVVSHRDLYQWEDIPTGGNSPQMGEPTMMGGGEMPYMANPMYNGGAGSQYQPQPVQIQPIINVIGGDNKGSIDIPAANPMPNPMMNNNGMGMMPQVAYLFGMGRAVHDRLQRKELIS